MKALTRALSKRIVFFISMLLLTISNSALADDTYIKLPNITIQKPALTGSIVGEALTGWVDSAREQKVDQGPIGQFGLQISSSVLPMSYSENGVSYSVYDIKDYSMVSSGIGFILKTSVADCAIGCAYTGPYAQNTGNSYRQFRNGVFAIGGVFYTYSVKLIATSKNIRAGAHTFGGGQAGSAVTIGVNTWYKPVYLSPATLIYQQSGCIVSTSPAVIKMGVVSPLMFNGVGSTVVSNVPLTVSLQCTDNVGVLATMTDQNNSSNNTQVLQLTSGSTTSARGVGVQFRKENGLLVSFGRDSSAVDQSSSAQWRVKSKNGGNTAQFVLRPEYVQVSSSISPGSANALVSITFAYD